MSASVPTELDRPTGPPEPGREIVPSGAEIIPGYRVISLLRRGNRLDVYDAWSERRASRCVIKTVLPDRRHEPAVVAGLVHEGRLLQRLDHPHWVRAYEVITDPAPAIVLETLAGSTLAALLDDARRLRPADVVLLGVQVGSALRYLHSLGWLHLDLTPTNVVVDAGRARLIDLSLAARPGPVRRAMGTDGYRAPETLAGDSVSTATDVHGLGTLLLECLTGIEPITEDDPRPRPSLRSRLPWHKPPAWLLDLVIDCRQVDPARRPSLDEVLARLDPSVAALGPTWGDDSASEHETPLIDRSRRTHAGSLD